jgi:chorismate synthase
MSFNTFGKIFRFTTWGESHGPAIGCVVDGCPPNIAISEKIIQLDMNRRRPGKSKFTSQRKEADKVEILSGVFEGKTTGTPISMIIYNNDAKSRDYETIKNKFRPGHADYTYLAKYGIRDYRGGGRQSARETATRVAAGAIAKTVLKKFLGKKFKVIGGVTQLGVLACNKNNWNDNEIRKNSFFCPDKKSIKLWEKYLLAVRKAGSSCGAIIELRASGVPAGLGAPIYSKLDSDLAGALMSINAVKGVNIGAGMNSAFLSGEENSDEIRNNKGKAKFQSNNSGGILGGISSGQEVIASFAVKPTSSILNLRNTIDKKGKNTSISVRGRHDPCVGIRAVPVGEAMMACVLLDHYLLDRAQSNR